MMILNIRTLILMQTADPHGVMVAITSICVVFAVLAAMYCAYTVIGKIFGGKEPEKKEQPKPTSKALMEIDSPLPGIVLEVKVKAGDVVKEGQVIAVIEAMKMENEIRMEQGGVVTAVHVAAGEFIPQGKSIITIV